MKRRGKGGERQESEKRKKREREREVKEKEMEKERKGLYRQRVYIFGLTGSLQFIAIPKCFLVEFLIVLDDLVITFFATVWLRSPTKHARVYLFYLFNAYMYMMLYNSRATRKLVAHETNRHRPATTFWSASRQPKSHVVAQLSRKRVASPRLCGVLRLFCMHFPRVAASCQDTARLDEDSSSL